MQQYGRSGAHLGGKSLAAGCPDESRSYTSRKGPGLFGEILSKGYSIVYRWAPMKSKEAALKTETQLLNTFDYAWNKGSNGIRRPGDIIQKLNKVASIPSHIAVIRRRLMPLIQKQAGVKIEAAKLESSVSETGISNFLNQVFKFNRSQPRLLYNRIGEKNGNICGVVLGNGLLCRVPPVKGKKRCSEHKGLKIRQFSSPIFSVRKSDGEKGHDTLRKQEFNHDEDKAQDITLYYPASEYFTPICGIILKDGTSCTREPVQGRKRCSEHKGMRIQGSSFSLLAKKEPLHHTDNQEFNCDVEKPQHTAFSHPASEYFTPVCGIILNDGTSCTRKPIQGRKRCVEHKGMRLRGASFSSLAEKKPSHLKYDQEIICDEELSQQTALKYSASEDFTPICGVILTDGTNCSRQPVKGRKRCTEHKGMTIRSTSF